MSEVLKNLALDRWYKICIYVGVVLFMAALLHPVQWLTNEQVGLLGATAFFIGLGEWNNEKTAVAIKQANAYTGPAALIQLPVRRVSILGGFLLAVGFICLILFARTFM